MPGIHPNFIQDAPQTSNLFECDLILKSYFQHVMPREIWTAVAPQLSRFGERCAGEIAALGLQAESQPPQHVPYDAWGRRIDHIKVCPAWECLHEISAEEGLVAIGYERREGEYSRLYQFAKLFLFHPSSAFYSCPLAMTDGAARVIELFGSARLKAGAFVHLTSRDPKKFWTSGQWMTEKTGGSDVSGTSTIAQKDGGGFRLFGDKWFTSATTSRLTMALAKVEGATDSREGLSLFALELRDAAGNLDHIRVNRLKDKLGTKALPTAELTLEGVPAEMIGGVGEGVKRVSSILNITRLYNSVTALAAMAHALQLAKDYSGRRTAFGRKLMEHPLHVTTLARLQVEYEGCFVLGFHLLHLLGREETGRASGEAREEESAILRLLTPVIKLWTAKQCLLTVSEVIECFGGSGYIEDTGIPRLLRDAQVFSIWEGTTNVLSLDVLRALAKDQALEPYFKLVESRLAKVSDARLSGEVTQVRQAISELGKQSQTSADQQEAQARDFAFALARTYAASLLLELASQPGGDGLRRERMRLVSQQFCRLPLAQFTGASQPDDLRKILSI